MRIAIVGTGISGLVAAHLLHRDHDLTIFEASDYVGGHTHTVEVDLNGQRVAVDTGFIVYNERNYPNFTRLLAQLGVDTQPSTMSFSVKLDNPELEYNGSTFRQLFVQHSNLLRPRFYRMLADIVRFNRSAPAAIANGAATLTLGDYVGTAGFSREFIDHYLVPMGAAIWSSPAARVLEMPAGFFIRFFENHGMLTIDDRPEWRTIKGGSVRYVEHLTAPFLDRIRLNTPARHIRRTANHVLVNDERFDEVVIACHSDQALDILDDPSDAEREILAALPYQSNEVVLHTDTSLLPRRRRAWGAWNYHMSGLPHEPVGVTYNMNVLQSLAVSDTLCVTLNDTESIAPERIIDRFTYSHPLFTLEGIQAQQRHSEISGQRHTHYCGAYWRNGFHEDGVVSALAVGRAFGVSL
ncbi:MAG: FAD-dependent oxidoreductase [Gemmatimonadota bacterium]|nr:MAG: FAD-dependent oxidoreductase [Gemmatimonadota bacterium]